MVTLLTVADPEVGLGHLYRCDALAQAMVRQGGDVHLVVSCGAGQAWLSHRAPESPDTLADWTGDVAVLRKSQELATVTVVDAYNIPQPVWDYLCTANTHLAVFDDWGEQPRFKGTLINGSPGARLFPYETLPDRRLLLGVDYHALRPPFWVRSNRTVRHRVSRVGIMAGGTDHSNTLSRIVSAVEAAVGEDTTLITIGRASKADDRTRFAGFLPARELRDLFDDLDLLVSAAGQTVAEAVSRALPTVMVQTADNQEANVQGWRATGAALFGANVATGGWSRQLVATLEYAFSFQNRKAMAEAARRLDLSLSTQRLARAIMQQS